VVGGNENFTTHRLDFSSKVNAAALILTFTNSYKLPQALCISPNPRTMTIKINPTVVEV